MGNLVGAAGKPLRNGWLRASTSWIFVNGAFQSFYHFMTIGLTTGALALPHLRICATQQELRQPPT